MAFLTTFLDSVEGKTPRFCLFLTIAQLAISIAALATAAYGVSGLSWAHAGDFTIVTSTVTIILTTYILITTLAPFQRVREAAVALPLNLVLTLVLLVLWLVATIWLAVWTATYHYNNIDIYLLSPLFSIFHGHPLTSIRNIHALNWEKYRDVLQASAGLSAAEIVLFGATLTLLTMQLLKSRTADAPVSSQEVTPAAESQQVASRVSLPTIVDEEAPRNDELAEATTSTDAISHKAVHKRTPSVASAE